MKQFVGYVTECSGVGLAASLLAAVHGLEERIAGEEDGSVLWVDGRKVVDNDGLHSFRERGKLLSLAAGYHAIKVAFFNSPKGGNLGVYWQPPGEKKQLLPANVLFHTGGE